LTNVTEPYMPDKDKYKQYIDEIYKNKWLTNNGTLVQELTKRLEEYLGVKHLLLVSNGTLALQIASSVLNVKNKVLTTPFSFVATTSSQLWEGIDVVYSDIDKDSFNLSANEISNHIDNNVEAIIPVHVFGNPCDVEKISVVAKEKNVKVIYDAAHAFGVKYKGKSILSYGDISILSFHATKLFHTVEGGALIFNDEQQYNKAKSLINFGYCDGEIDHIGINAKMSEFHAAMGLCVLDDIEIIIEDRKKQYEHYLKELKNSVVVQSTLEGTEQNYSYFPVVLENEKMVLNILEKLKVLNIFPRRYFYPSLNKLSYMGSEQSMPISEHISECIICLPIFVGLKKEIQDIVIKVILERKE